MSIYRSATTSSQLSLRATSSSSRVGGCQRRIPAPHYSLFMVRDRAACRPFSIRSDFMTAFKKRSVCLYLRSTKPRQLGVHRWLPRMGATEYRDVLAAREWLKGRTDNDTPVIICGLSMGGATSIYALRQGCRQTGYCSSIPCSIPVIRSNGGLGWLWAPVRPISAYGVFSPLFWDLPYGASDALEVAKALDLPIAIVQNKTDPITRSIWSEELANASDSATIAFVPRIDASDPCMADKGRWGTHASSFHCHPDWTIEQVENLIARLR